MPRVSVIVPAYNCARFVDRTVRSALDQTYTDREIIVVDDGSTDKTREVIARFGDRVRYFYQTNRGVAAARNFALSKASGELVAYLDSDDIWYPQKLKKQVEYLDSNSGHGLIHTDIDVIDEEDQFIHHRFNQKTGREIPQGHCQMELLRYSHIQTLTVLVRRKYLDQIGNFDERLKGTEDYLQWILVSMEGATLGYVDEPLAKYRWTKGSISSSQRWMCQDLTKMFNILLNEKLLEARGGTQAVKIVRQRLYTIARELAYIERTEGHHDQARRRLMSLIKDWPLRMELYRDLLKTCVPSVVADRIHAVK